MISRLFYFKDHKLISSGMITDIQNALDSVSSNKTKIWWERYMKHKIPFRGVPMSGIRECVHRVYETVSEYDVERNESVALNLLRQPFAEDKLAGIILLQEIHLKQEIEVERLFDLIFQLFESGYIYEWNTCDWMSLKVLHHMVMKAPEKNSRILLQWIDGESFWTNRASIVAFIPHLKNTDVYYENFTIDFFKNISLAFNKNERFMQTAIGWALRELWLNNSLLVEQFIEQNISEFTSEGLRYAIEKMPESNRNRFIAMRNNKTAIRK